jgi:hypothetical protein
MNDLGFLNRLRGEIFIQAIEHEGFFETILPRNETEELILVAGEFFKEPTGDSLKKAGFLERVDSISQKLFSRLERVENELMSPDFEAATLFGPKGIIDETLR